MEKAPNTSLLDILSYDIFNVWFGEIYALLFEYKLLIKPCQKNMCNYLKDHKLYNFDDAIAIIDEYLENKKDRSKIFDFNKSVGVVNIIHIYFTINEKVLIGRELPLFADHIKNYAFDFSHAYESDKICLLTE
jgi:hypothetical protein